MRVNAANDITAAAFPRGNNRVQIRIGVHRFTATTDEALELLEAVDSINREREQPGHG
ncbi:hypothetical protein [Mycobacterium palustre]|uniref:hypothetical protein n=1 Tax=Mycobacterium palustre TaxID=153971 RepID=UPI00130240E9|nr:hypothetical protein [Mycobacterium palustre]MCV7101531.1 hypothetical protein [Mycobacterium palustre]